MPIFSRTFLLLLIISLGMSQKANTSPQSDKNLVHVGYVGESLQNIPDAYGKMIRQKMLALLRSALRCRPDKLCGASLLRISSSQ